MAESRVSAADRIPEDSQLKVRAHFFRHGAGSFTLDDLTMPEQDTLESQTAISLWKRK